jgi:UbiD family decarboxylase
LSDLREWISAADKAGILRRVKEETDLRWVSPILNENRKQPVLFEKLVGYDYPLVGQTISCLELVAFALGTEPTREAVRKEYAKRVSNPLKPVHVQSAPCQDIVDQGKEVDLIKFPIPLQHSTDGGAYISCGVLLCKDPVTYLAAYPGEVNLGMYRHMVYTKNQMGIDFVSPNRTNVYYKKLMEEGKPLEVAILVGLHPLGLMSSVEPERDIEMMGALQGKPVELVHCKTVDLDVPSNVEIVIEGEIPPIGWTVREGPYGEFTGYQSEVKENPVVNVKAITYRKNPIFQTATIGTKDFATSDTVGIYLANSLQESPIIQEMRRRGFDVRAVNDMMGFTIVSMKKWFEGQARNLILSWGSHKLPHQHYPKYLVVVDDDIDVKDPAMVAWALSTRSKPDEDIIVLSGMTAKPLDPSNATHSYNTTSSRMGIDATKPLPPFAQPHEWQVSVMPFQGEKGPAGRKAARQGKDLQQLTDQIHNELEKQPLQFQEILKKFGDYEYRSILLGMCQLREQNKILQDNAGKWQPIKQL